MTHSPREQKLYVLSVVLAAMPVLFALIRAAGIGAVAFVLGFCCAASQALYALARPRTE